MSMEMRKHIRHLVDRINPLDALERWHIQDTLNWIDSGAPLFRIQKPDVPNKHLISYFVPFDRENKKVMLVDHIKAQLWLPPGGHVDPGEDPLETARRECQEELQVSPIFILEAPLFLTSTVTVGLTAGHTDVSLWYLVDMPEETPITYDPKEFNGIQWFDLDQIPFEKSDPHMKRFVEKAEQMLKLYG